MTSKQMSDDPKIKTKASGIKDFISFIVITAIVVLPIRIFVAQPFVVSGSSMSPTFENGEYLIVDQLSYNFSEPARGDVIIFRYPINPEKFFIKRIIGLPGDTVKIDGNEVLIKNAANPEGISLDQSFVVFSQETSLEITLADDNYFVMGDNRAASLDSRSWGPLKRDLIVGRAFIRLWPFNKIDYLPGGFLY
ncbi:MAG TPA: signal peptidase I [Candidatus Paceibacterota bacterium]|nr:signal peptidase I [Candidatus Paceibacterota bacterium]HRZ34601.1 signal peptidase I [Candidatus Paceibacterota bacterium]